MKYVCKKTGKEREKTCSIIAVVKGFYVFASKETLSPTVGGKSLFFIGGFSEHHLSSLLLIGCTFLDRSTAAHSHTLKLSKRHLLYIEQLYYSSWRSSALLKGILTVTAFSCVSAITFQSPYAYLHKSNKFLSNMHIFAKILTNSINYLLLCYDVSSFIMSVIGFCTQQAEVKQTQGESGC